MFFRHVTKDISAYCHGELSSEESKQFAEHLIACAKCRTKFEEVKLGIKLAEQLPRLSAPDHLWSELEPLLAKQTTARPSVAWMWQSKVAAAAVLLLVVSAGIFWIYRSSRVVPQNVKPSWLVKRLDGAPRIGSEQISNNGRLAIGEWLETDGSSRAQIDVATIGNVDIEENSRVRLLQTRADEHRLELVRGKMSARIWAPPRLFFVDTPSAVAADYGCAYTLEVKDDGGSLLHVTSGWVALESKDRETLVPAGASCDTRPGVGPGTAYYEDASPSFREALTKVDFERDATALTTVLDQARPRDTLTLWHLFKRSDGHDRERLYDKLTSFVPPPPGVTREGMLSGDEKMTSQWLDVLEPMWTGNGGGKMVPKKVADAYFRVRNGLSRRLKDMAPK
jgi:ferric-dicitrate binding protein FerR (iron transport regulator)